MKLCAGSLALVFAGVLALTSFALAQERRSGMKHPVLAHAVDPKRAAEYERAVARVMAMSEDEMLAFVPPWAYVAYCECPNCYGGVEGNGVLVWSIEQPEQLKCRFCGTVVLPNEKYPEDRVLTGRNKLGDEIRFPYYHNEEKKVPHFLSTHLWRLKRAWLTAQCEALGRAYLATGKEDYARRVALALDRMAQRYPHYPVMQNLPRRFTFRESQDPPYLWDSGKWNYFHNEIPIEIIPAYDVVYDSPAFDELSQQRGYDVRAKIEKDFLKAAFAAAEVSKYHVSNVVGYDVRSAAILGWVIAEPRYVHWAFARMKENMDVGFFRDGMWHEAPSYHYMTIGGLKRCFDAIRGYSDPPGYVDAVDGTRFDNLEPEKQLPFWAKAQRAPEVIGFPNGLSCPVHDTHPGEKRAAPRGQTVSTIAPAYGHASLGRGSGPHQMLAQLHFSGDYGHHHSDNLNLTLWAKEREMLPDLGYTWTQMRYWTTCTLGHNLVVVDRKDQVGRPADGDLLSFFPGSSGVAVVEADGKRAYSNIKGLDTYRRLLVMIPVSEADAYVVDIFRVRGGAMHDWALHGDADEDTAATCSLPLGEKRATMLEPGEAWVEPTIEGARFNPYGMLRDMRKAETDAGFQVAFAYAQQPERGLRVHLLPGGRSEVWLGKSPSVRRMGYGISGDMRKAYDFWMPQLLVRRAGQAPLASVFVAVEEPFAGTPFITGVAPLKLTPADDGGVALQVRHGDAVDTIISTEQRGHPSFPGNMDVPFSVSGDGVQLKGHLGIVRRQSGKVTGAWLFEGQSLSGEGFSVKAERERYTGEIVAAMRKADGAADDAFLTDAPLPVGDALRGAWMIVTYANGFRQGYEIDRVEKRDGKTWIILTDDHGLRIEANQTQEVFFPRRKMDGKNTFVIPLAATLARS